MPVVLQTHLVGDAVAALAVLLVNVTLSVYKPQGLTAYGRRKLREQRPDASDSADGSAPAGLWLKVLAAIVVALMLLFVMLHLAGRGPGSLHH